jgi:hypothetical protein
LTPHAPPGFNSTMSAPPPTKAEDPAADRAAARQARRAAVRQAAEAEALRANLHRRKQQSRARTDPPAAKPAPPCR